MNLTPLLQFAVFSLGLLGLLLLAAGLVSIAFSGDVRRK
jgi:hypothetical protein